MSTIITEQNEFLKSEFDKCYNRLFDKYEEFVRVMGNELNRCRECEAWYWKGTTPPCECRHSPRNIGMGEPRKVSSRF